MYRFFLIFAFAALMALPTGTASAANTAQDEQVENSYSPKQTGDRKSKVCKKKGKARRKAQRRGRVLF